MDKKTTNILLSISAIALLVGGIIFLCISIFGSAESTTPLTVAFACIILGNLFNIIRIQFNKNDK
ncbi:MAG: hypothetical protein Q4A83_03580 [Bacillota bacterium]|nr:hypothetical protein [Bacillota bacterium]